VCPIDHSKARGAGPIIPFLTIEVGDGLVLSEPAPTMQMVVCRAPKRRCRRYLCVANRVTLALGYTRCLVGNWLALLPGR
jgi:hypothetical protein